MLVVKSRLCGKTFTIKEKKSNAKPASIISFLDYSFSKKGISPNPKHVEKIKFAKSSSNTKQLVFCWPNKFLPDLPDFATKMLHLNEVRKDDF